MTIPPPKPWIPSLLPVGALCPVLLLPSPSNAFDLMLSISPPSNPEDAVSFAIIGGCFIQHPPDSHRFLFLGTRMPFPDRLAIARAQSFKLETGEAARFGFEPRLIELP
jgi:hypothetical protein